MPIERRTNAMGKYEPKTKMTETDPRAWLQALVPARRSEEGLQLLEMMETITGEQPRMWGDSMIGFGSRHYEYASGHGGDWFRIGFSPRKAALSLYLLNGYAGDEPLLEKLGKHRRSVSCLYVNKLSDIDMDVLSQLIGKAWQETGEASGA